MKKYIYISFFVLFNHFPVHSQISYKGENLTDAQLAEGNQEIITNASTIIDGIMLESQLKSLVKEKELDGVDLIKLTHVLRSGELKTGDTIIVIFRNIAYGTESMYEPNPNGYPSAGFSLNPNDHRSLNCEWFLKEYTGEINLKALNWQNNKVYEFYLTKFGCAIVYFKDYSIKNPEYDVYALFNLKFKTRQEWYNYLKTYDNIKVPEGY